MSATDICQSTDSVVAVWRCAHAADISVLFFCVHRWWAHCVSSTAGQDGVINKKSYERLKKKQCDLDLKDNRQQRARNRKATECTTAAVFSHRRQQDDSKRELEDQNLRAEIKNKKPNKEIKLICWSEAWESSFDHVTNKRWRNLNVSEDSQRRGLPNLGSRWAEHHELWAKLK